MPVWLEQPSLLLNSYAFTGPFGGCGLSMDFTYNCPKTTKVKDIVNYILVAYNKTPARHLHNVVLNFHGREEGPGKGGADEPMVLIGEASAETGFGTGQFREAAYNAIDLKNVGAFAALRGKNIGTIWFHSCALAKDLKGKYFCQRLAEVSNCKVVAAADTQYEYWDFINAIFMPKGAIDDFEGQVYLWTPTKNGVKFGPFNPNEGNWS